MTKKVHSSSAKDITLEKPLFSIEKLEHDEKFELQKINVDEKNSNTRKFEFEKINNDLGGKI